MNNFLFEERLAEEYRREKMAIAEEHNRYAHIAEKKMTLLTYKILSKIGEALENLGCKMKARYEKLALREEHNLLPNPAE